MNAMCVIYYVKQKPHVRLLFWKSQHTPTGSETAVVTLATRVVLFIFLEMIACRLYLYLLNSH